MTTKLIGLAFVAALLTLAPVGAADAGNETSQPERPDDAAWVDDCPPDMMCAASANETDEPKDDTTTRGPEDCEYCRDHQEADCPDCVSSPMPAGDNTTWGTDCPPGVQCMVTDAPEEVQGGLNDAGVDEAAEASALGFAVIGLAALAGIVAVSANRRR